MKSIENIINRNSSKKLEKPYPNKKEMELIYKAALRAPDHAMLRPTRFIEITGKGLDRLSKTFNKYAKENISELDPKKLEKYTNAPYRAPMIIVLVTEFQNHPKVPEIEQMLSTAAAAQNILLAVDSLGYGAIWRTGIFALDKNISRYFDLNEKQKILGYIYIGTRIEEKKKISHVDIKKFVSCWNNDSK